MKQCENCGIEMDDDALVCPSCDKEVEEITEEEEITENDSADLEEEKSEDEQDLTDSESEDNDTEEDLEDEAEESDDADEDEEDIEDGDFEVEIEDGAHKSKGKGAFAVGVVAIALIVVAALLLVFVLPKKFVTKDVSDPILYSLEDGSVRIMSETLKEPVTITQDFVEYAKTQGSFIVSGDHKKVAYINDYGELYIVPVKEGHDITKDMSAGYKVASDAAQVFSFSEDSKFIPYQNMEDELFLYDGVESYFVDSGVGEAMLVASKYLVYIKVDDVAQSASLYCRSTDKPDGESTLVVEGIAGFYLSNDSKGKTTNNIIYLTSSEDGQSHSAHSYNLATGKEVLIEENSKLGIMISLEKDTEVIYSVREAVAAPANEGGVQEITDIDAEIEMHTLYKSKNGNRELLAEGIESFYLYDDRNNAIVYRQVTDEGYQIVYQQETNQPQVLYTPQADEVINAIIDDKAESVVLIIYTDATMAEITAINQYQIKTGKASEARSIDPDAIFVHDHSVKGTLFYVKEQEAAAEASNIDGDVDLFSFKDSDQGLIQNGVYIPSIITDYKYPDDAPFLYMTDVNVESDVPSGKLHSYDGSKASLISEGVWVGGDYSVPVFYQGKTKLLYIKDYDVNTMKGNLYISDTSKGTETLIDSNVIEVF